MKIDLHTHTKQCKSGDAPTRAISPKDFCTTVLSTDVGIIAITNHNIFDLVQFREIEAFMEDGVQVWPGIELDIIESGSRSHLLVVVSPKKAVAFSEAVNSITEGTTPDSFTATIERTLFAFDGLGPLYIAHYGQKKPSITDEALARLASQTANPYRVIKEVTNAISAGIYISHGHPSIHGSDVQNWARYEELSRDLPELRLAVDSFEHFCLLLEKDPTTINTALNRKTAEELHLVLFEDDPALRIRVFNDINVVFGPKGTGKSCILRAIAKYYSENGVAASVYESASDRLDEIYDIKGNELAINLNTYSIHYCTDEIESLRNAHEVDVTSLGKFIAHFAAKTTNKNARRLLLKEIAPQEEGVLKREFGEFAVATETTANFLQFLRENPAVKKELNSVELGQTAALIQDLLERLQSREWIIFSEWKEVTLLNSAILKFRTEVERKTGSPAKPTGTGFREYALNRIEIELNVAKILKSVETTIPLLSENVGTLGSEKGNLEFRTEFVFQSGRVTDGTLKSLADVNKSLQKKFISQVRKVHERVWSDDLFQSVAELNSITEGEKVKSVYELLQFKRYFAVNGQSYTPSSGEASMVMLQKELGADKDVYILDEPERSLGNEYINDVIVPLIKERARNGRKVFISTHDANIAVRTLPYSSIYRCHGPQGYSTYVGNPFSNNLVNLANDEDRQDWKQVSMKTLEGGEQAFGERGKIYGNS